MKKILFAASVLLSAAVSYSAFSQDNKSIILKKVYDADHEESYYIGEFTDIRELSVVPGFEQVGHIQSIQEKVSPTQLTQLTQSLQDVQVVLLLGTWCGDSKEWAPEMINMLMAAGLQSSQLKVYALDRDKKGLNDIQVTFNVEYVPTIIFYKNEQELGRIVESPEQSLVEDFIKILNQ